MKMVVKRLAATALFVGLLPGVLGAEIEAVQDPLLGLTRRGINSARLNELYFDAQKDETCHCSLACEILATEFGDDGVHSSGQETYDACLARFWSNQQAHAQPRCFFHPRDAEEVSVMVLLARATQCPFAVKGAGHAAFKGGSNSDGGITVEFIHMKQVVPSADRKTVSIDPGNTWLDVYSTLEQDNLTVIGGRVASVGVGGLLLGGGISFFTGQYGWACDNVVNYEVVLASGDIEDVNAGSHADLFWALRGGSGNFGVVTRFDVNAIEQGLMWGGDLWYEFHSSKAAVVDAVVGFAEAGAADKDPKAHMIASFGYAQAYDMWVSAIQLQHADPHPEGSHPAVFDGFFLEDIPPMASTLRTSSLANLTIAVDAMSPFGFRNTYWTLTTRVDAQLLTDMAAIWAEEVTVLKNVTGIVPAVSLQVISPPQRASMTRNGGNALGLGGEGEEPLFLLVSSMAWALESDDELVLTAAHNFITRSEALAKERRLDHPFLCTFHGHQ